MIIFKSLMKRIFKSKIRFIIIMLGPFIFIALFAFHNHRAVTIGFVDYDLTAASEAVCSQLSHTDGIKLMKITEDQVYDLTASYVIDYSLIIGEGFEKAILDGDSPKIREYYIEDRQKLHFVKNSVSTEIENYQLLAKASGYEQSRFEAAIQKYASPGLSVVTGMKGMNKMDNTRGALGFLIQFMLYMAVITTGLILEDKASGIYYRTFYSPISSKRYMAESLAAFYTTAIIQCMGIILALVLVFRIYLGSMPLAVIGLFAIFSLVCIAMGLLLTTILKSPMQAYVAAAAITTPLVMLGGCYWDFAAMPWVLNKVGSFLPVSWVMRTVDAILDGSITAGALAANYGMLLLFAAIFLIAGLQRKVDIS